MDPNETLAIMRQTVREFQQAIDRGEQADHYDNMIDLGDTMAEAFDALDQWLSKGGFQPNWTKGD